MFSLILSTLGALGRSWLDRRKIKAAGKIEIEKAKVEGKIKHVQTLADAMAQQDLEATKGMAGSWKDEYLIIVLTIPAILCFVPGAVDIVKDGFSALAMCPKWYQGCLVGAIAASFGIKGFLKLKNGHK